MFGLMRRISSGFIPRPDRPWQEDATSNAPQVGKKRRRSSVDEDVEERESTPKKARGDTPAELEPGSSSSPVPETEAVKEVTKGVNEVELEDKAKVKAKKVPAVEKGQADGAKVEESEKADLEEDVAPESVPLPEEVSGELDETSSIRSTPPAEEAAAAETKEVVESELRLKEVKTADEAEESAKTSAADADAPPALQVDTTATADSTADETKEV